MTAVARRPVTRLEARVREAVDDMRQRATALPPGALTCDVCGAKFNGRDRPFTAGGLADHRKHCVPFPH